VSDHDETISGEMTKGQRLLTRFSPWFVSLLFVGFLSWSFFCSDLSPLGTSPATGLRIAGVAFICVAVSIIFVYLSRDANQEIVEFTCDETSFRFRKLGNARTETRTLSEIVTVCERCDKSGTPRACRLLFRGGAEALLWYGVLPNSVALAERLRYHVPRGR